MRPEEGGLHQVVGLQVSQGRLVFARGELRVTRGAGRYIKRPAFGPQFAAAALRSTDQAAMPVSR